MAKGSCIDGVATPALPLCLVCVDGESGAVVGSIDVMALGACTEVWAVRAAAYRAHSAEHESSMARNILHHAALASEERKRDLAGDY